MKNSLFIFKPFLIPLLVVTVVVLIIPFVILPQLERIKDKNIEVKGAEKRLDLLNQKIADLALVDEEEESIMLLELEKVIPGDKKVAQVIVGVKSLASESNLDITGMNFKPGRVGEEASKSATSSALSKRAKALEAQNEEVKDGLNFVINLKGALKDIRTFLAKLESAKRLMGIEILKAEQDEDDPSVYRFDLTINAPLKPTETENDVVGDPLPKLTSFHDNLFEFIINLKGYTTKKIQTVPTGVKDPFEKD